jgi:3-oxochol-4-en-24-oyl-CoA dehydrogenase
LLSAARLTKDGMRRTVRVNVGRDPELARIAALPERERRVALADGGHLTTADPRRQLLVDTELSLAGVAKPDLGIGAWAVPTIMAAGTAAQKERFVGPTLRGQIAWCQLFSEPEAGSDLASLRTKATRGEGGWILSGQKVWTSLAREADWAICLARTDFQAPKHKGITYFLVDMKSAGIDVRPLREITGEARFNEVFLDNLFVPDECVLGEPGGGWRLARTTLASERIAIGSALGEDVERLLGSHDDGDDEEALGSLVAGGLCVALLDLRATLRRLEGHEPGADSAVRKLLGVQHRQAVAEVGLLLSGLDGAFEGDETHRFLLMRCLSIAGGTHQILLSLVGERILGLPRDEVG